MSSNDRNPLISVVMTTYREELGRLVRAIASILTQSVSDLECIVVFEKDDKNLDEVSQKLCDTRLVVTRVTETGGMAACLNVGLAQARGRYIARMDSDDLAYPERLEKQVAFLKANPEVSLVGTAGRIIDESGSIVGIRRFPTTHKEILRSLIFTNPIYHPSVVWDAERVGHDIRYDTGFPAEDLELWLRLISYGHRVANLPEVLIDYTQPPNYLRPMRNWRGNLRARLKHWRLIWRYPPLLAGIIGLSILSALPQTLVTRLVGRNPLSDWLRSIREA